MKKSSDFRSPLSQARGLGSARDGTSHWWMQRILAVALVLLSAWFLYSLLSNAVYASPEALNAWLSNPATAIALLLTMSVMFFHAKLGLQVIIEDYVTCTGMRTFLMLGNIFFCGTLGLMSAVAILKILFS